MIRPLMTDFKIGDRVVCTCGSEHKGTIVHVLPYPFLLAVNWDDARREWQLVEPTFYDHLAKVGHMINVLAGSMKII
jgi:hypothetical protein